MSAQTFYYSVHAYDFHTYYTLGDEESKAEFYAFRKAVEEEFAPELTEGKCRIFRSFDETLGPHTQGMFETDTRDASTFLKLLNFYQLNHGNLSVLIHPRSGLGELSDHTKHALWLGEKVPLKESVLSDDRK
ncbi:hypothetical protein WICPIJ_003722 [Wickerhamomyces pijperi]|uniref:DOPA 4,5-dioxygenase n=1 Tax=Wickerhamomyces pijperi TaxID=599730 RepID=A0A9P8TNL3_WICPI|nr:hypothetical protein WICPIJ_003722 [Wickerhamomyces pijperi]